MNTQPSVTALITHANLNCKKYIHWCDERILFHFKIGKLWNLMKQSVTVGEQLLWSGLYGCNNGRYGCAIVMSYTEINKAVSQWLLTFNLCVSVTWPLTCAFHIPWTHTPRNIDMHRGVCDHFCWYRISYIYIGCRYLKYILIRAHVNLRIAKFNNHRADLLQIKFICFALSCKHASYESQYRGYRWPESQSVG